MLNIRSPWLPLCIGASAGLLAVLVWGLTDRELLGWLLMTGAMPLLIEASSWRKAAYFTPHFYGVDGVTVHWEAYDPRASIPRYALLYAYFFGTLAAREAQAIPDNVWSLGIFIVPALLYGWMAVTSYIRANRRLMGAKGLESKWSQRRQA